MVRKIKEHENIYLHIKKNTVLGLPIFLMGLCMMIYFFNMSSLSNELKAMMSNMEFIFMVLGAISYIITMIFLMIVGIQLMFDK